ncbi:MAG: PorP/SprF family type IX secretion system membrane protein [Bacteroidaceae bacterium]|nr:PorP/SprF family type IX secretion system membrane protein [Bacteroidaceae bacterium]
MKRRGLAALALALMCVSAVRAQWDVQFTDYTTLKSFYNPAVSGTDGMLNVAATYSMQMSGYKKAPSTLYASADLPVYFLSPRHGVGLSFFNENVSIFTTTKIALQYAYNLKISRRGRLAAGVQGGLMTVKANKSGIELEDNKDPAFPSSDQKGNKVDLGAGLYYYHPKMWLGVSGQHLLAPTVVLGLTNEVEIDRMYYLMGGCNIKIKHSLLSLQPSFLVQSDFDHWREDVQCKVIYERDGKKFYGGLNYSPDTSVALLAGGVFHGISLGYSYQLYTSGVGLGNGAHEVVLSYQTDLDLFKKGRNKHKSVRWL